MIRYMKQRDNYSCGPHAIINALKWAGMKISGKEALPKAIKACDCIYPHGTTSEDLDRALEHTPFIQFIGGISFPDLKTIDKYLEKGNGIILRFFWKPFRGHYVFIAGKKDQKYEVVNACEKSKTISFWTEKTLKRYLKIKSVKCGELSGSCIWAIKKVKI